MTSRKGNLPNQTEKGYEMITYKTYTIMVSFDNGASGKEYKVVAISALSAFQDIVEAYGDCMLIQQDMGV